MSVARTPTAGEVLVLGATGLLGQAVVAEARARARPVLGVARSGADRDLDVSDAQALEDVVRESSPTVIVNCVAVTSHQACEDDPGHAYIVNARTPALLSPLAAELDAVLVHISSDHFFTGDRSRTHTEDARVSLLNEYARTKYAGETFALTNTQALVVRTNIVGLRRWPGRPTFAEWALEAIADGRPLTLFDDFFTSSMHVGACASAVFDLLDVSASGLINVASSEVASKQAFVRALANELGIELTSVKTDSVRDLLPRRAESLGLDVTRAQRLLDRALPDLADTITAIVAELPDTKP